jgi:cytochrome b561
MRWRNDSRGYGVSAIALHWSTLLLLVAVYATIQLSEVFAKGSGPRAALEAWHYTLGLSVLAVTALRLALASLDRAPAIVPEPPRWQRAAARAAHVALYALLFAMPIVGWLLLSARGKPIFWFELQLPALVAPSRSMGKTLKEIHEAIATAGYFLVGMHAAAALFHHYVVCDNTLQRMLPRRKRRAA